MASDLLVAPSGSSTLTLDGDISENIVGTSLTLSGDGTATLMLSGTNTYTGGTLVAAGTLVVMDSAALADGTSLTVGAGGTAAFAAATTPDEAPSGGATPGAIAAVPEPATLALLATGGLLLFLYGLIMMSWRSQRRWKFQS